LGERDADCVLERLESLLGLVSSPASPEGRLGSEVPPSPEGRLGSDGSSSPDGRLGSEGSSSPGGRLGACPNAVRLKNVAESVNFRMDRIVRGSECRFRSGRRNQYSK